MKHIKKIIICLLAVFVLVGNQTTYVSAAEETAASVLSNYTKITVSKGGAAVEFYFNYADGTTVYDADFVGMNANYTYTLDRSGFSNGVWTIYVTARNVYSGATITLGAWCDIYGQTGAL